MKGRTVHVFLRTPLYRCTQPGASGQAVLTWDVMEVRGEVLDQTPTGLHIAIRELRDQHGEAPTPPPFDEIVLPGSKIDHVLVEP